jgi:hypothetical protein
MMTQLRIDLQGRGEVETFSWARVQAMGDDIQLALSVAGQVSALGQVLAHQPIGVFVGATLPRAAGIRKKQLNRERLCQTLVLGHLFPPIIGQGFAQQRGHVPELLCESLSGTRRIPSPPSVPGGPGAWSALPTIAGPLDEVARPVARYGAGGALGGTRAIDVLLGIWPRRSDPPRPRPARFARRTQRRQQFGPQGSAGQHIQTHIDRFGRELLLHVARIRASEASGNLFGRAALSR